MGAVLAVVVGAVYAAGIYLILRRNLVRVALGLVLLGHAANLLIFVSAGLRRGGPPIVSADGRAPGPGAADPLPQALVLTAIVIGFAVLAFVLALAHRATRELGTDDVDEMEAAG